ncbi:MAG: MarR family transcriptional regulator [Promethearchaeota archaeon]
MSSKETSNKLEVLDPEIKEIEDQIIQFLVTNLFYRYSHYSATILAYFLTREGLTQKHLQKLTGFSAGKISEELNRFIKIGYIERKKFIKGQYIYKMPEIGQFFRNIFFGVKEKMVKWEKRIKGIQNELKRQKDLQNLNGYDKINEAINLFVPIFDIYHTFMEQLDDIEKDLIDS